MDIERLRAAVGPVAEGEGLRLVVLFGSAVRDPVHAEDLDIGVDAGAPCDTIAWTNRLARALGRSDVDVTDLRRADPVLLLRAAEEGVLLFQSDPSRFVRFFSLAARRFYDTRKLREVEHREIHDRLRDYGAERRAARPPTSAATAFDAPERSGKDP